MTPDQQAAKIDRDRRRREEELLLLLLALLDRAQREAVLLLSHGLDPAIAIRDVLGDARNGVAAKLAYRMALAHRDAYGRLETILPGSGVNRTRAPSLGELQQTYRQQAQDATDATIVALIAAVREAQATTPSTLTLESPTLSQRRRHAQQTVAEAFTAAGYADEASRSVELGIERNIVLASNAGLVEAAIATGRVTGLRHISVLDKATTEYCRPRNGLTLAVDDPFWQRNFPPLHWNCRSVIVPVTGVFTPSSTAGLPTPASGFGAAPLGLLETYRRQAAV